LAVGEGWAETGTTRPASTILRDRHLIAQDLFDQMVSLQFVDMKIPSSLATLIFAGQVAPWNISVRSRRG
jgi:hypothetical protein